MNELELIQLLTRNLPANDTVVTGPGDDCAVLNLGIPGKHLLFKTDAVVEGIHFTRETPPEKIGHKALARCLSDIAAMGGTPTSALVTLGLPKGFDPALIQSIYAGMNQLAARHGVAIVGGETTTNPERVLISIALLGLVPVNQCTRRSGSQAGDGIFVTGTLGGSIAGRHLDFEPRLAEARWLVENFPPHAMIDLSDGLASDIRPLLEPQQLGAELLATAIPISRDAKLFAKENPSAKPALLAALTDGEDFELLFTQPPGVAVKLLDGWKAQFPDTPLACIGKVLARPGITLRDATGLKPMPTHGYVHFA